jgi:metal-responsive CopG/Arc/MetJ family transcriptional regulator
MKRFAVSIPEDLASAVERLVGASQAYRKGSYLVADALDQFLKSHYPELAPSSHRIYPTVLWKLCTKRLVKRGPSPWLESRKKLGEWKLVELP